MLPNRHSAALTTLKTAAFLGMFCLQACGGKEISQTTISIDSKDLDSIKSIFRGVSGPYPELTIRVWRYNSDNKTIAEVYTPDDSGRVTIPLKGNTLSWGWGIRVGNSLDYPIPVAAIATHFDQPALAERQMLNEDEKEHMFRRSFSERPDPGISFNWATLILTGVSVATPTVAVQNQFGSLGQASMLPVSADNTVELPLWSQPDQYGNLGPFIWASEWTSAGVPTRYGYIPNPGPISSSSLKALRLNFDYHYTSIPWAISSENLTPLNGVISIDGEQSGRMARATIRDDIRQGFIAVPTQLPETDYTLRFDYTAGAGACTLTTHYNDTLPQKIDLNLEPLSIVGAQLDAANNRIDWQIEQAASAEVELFFSRFILFQWLATAPSSHKSWTVPQIPKALLTSADLKKADIFLDPINMVAQPKKIAGLGNSASTNCSLWLPNL